MAGRLCGDCNTYKSWSCFSISRREKSGHQSICKLCAKSRACKYRPVSTVVRNLETKVCSTCKLTLPRASFYKRFRSSVQIVSRCKSCVSLYKKEDYRQKQIQLGRAAESEKTFSSAQKMKSLTLEDLCQFSGFLETSLYVDQPMVVNSVARMQARFQDAKAASESKPSAENGSSPSSSSATSGCDALGKGHGNFTKDRLGGRPESMLLAFKHDGKEHPVR